MRKVLLLSALAVSVLLLAACIGGQPHVEVDVTRHDFGAIPQGEVATVQIPVRNTGKADLKIESVSTSCGCTTADVQPTVIPPGGEGTLTIRYDSGSHPDTGKIRRDVFVATNDPDEQEVVVIITADVQPPGK